MGHVEVSKGMSWTGVGVRAAAGGAVLLGMSKLPISDIMTQAISWIEDQGDMGPVYYVLFLGLWVTALLPCSVVEMVPGYLFGFKTGLICSLAGKNLGNLMSVLIGRYLLKDRLQETLIKKYPMLKAFEKAIKEEGFKIICLIRVTYLPMLIKNYGLSVLDVPVSLIFLSSLATGLPFAAGWTLLGSSAKDLGSILRGEHSLRDALPMEPTILLPVVVVFLVCFAYVASSFARKMKVMMAEATADMEAEEEKAKKIN